METNNLDVVIPLKAENDNEELRYCLRSIAKNLPHRKVFLAGFKPDWAQNVELIDVPVADGLKYSKSMVNTRAACSDDRVSDDFILFNDDFFVMKPVDRIEPVQRGSLKRFHSLYFQMNHRWRNYRDGIGRMRKVLAQFDLDDTTTRSYELHLPMIFNKAKRRKCYEIQDRFPAGDWALHTNTLYGNLFVKSQITVPDVKYFDPEAIPDETLTFISSDDISFRDGIVGDYVRRSFKERCKYEHSI